MEDLFHLTMSPREINQISVLGLAHCGDAVFELLVRSFLCTAGRKPSEICTARRWSGSARPRRPGGSTGCSRF
ncbi:MAG: hypothetical protein ACLUFI_14645 [Oscillospiraceae bacterium]